MEFERFTMLVPVRKKSKSLVRPCSVSNCDSVYGAEVAFHQFPKSREKIIMKNPAGGFVYCDRRKVWADVIGIDQKITSKLKVCSVHFTPEDYISQRQKGKRLKATAIPTLNLPEESSPFLSFKRVNPREFNPKNSNQNINKASYSAMKRSSTQTEQEQGDNGIGTDIVTTRDSLNSTISVENVPEPCDSNVVVNKEKDNNKVTVKSEKVDLTQETLEYKYEFDYGKSVELKMTGALFNKSMLDVLLMHTTFEIENFTSGNFSRITHPFP